MKSHHLRAWLSLVDAGSIRAAARAMHLSQAAVTKAIKELEQDVGAALVIRSAKGVVMTECGEALTIRARLAEKQLQMARQDISSLQGGSRGKVHVGVTPMVTMTILASVIARFRRTMPEAELGFFEGLAPAVLPALRHGEIDFAVVLVDPAHIPPDLAFEPLATLPFMIMGRKDHPLRNAHAWKALVNQEWLMNIAPGSHNQRFLASLDMHGLARPHRIIESDAFGVMWNLMLRSDALIVCPRAMLQTSYAPELCCIDVDIPIPTSKLGILSSTTAPLSLAAGRLAEYFRHEMPLAAGLQPSPAARSRCP